MVIHVRCSPLLKYRLKFSALSLNCRTNFCFHRSRYLSSYCFILTISGPVALSLRSSTNSVRVDPYKNGVPIIISSLSDIFLKTVGSIYSLRGAIPPRMCDILYFLANLPPPLCAKVLSTGPSLPPCRGIPRFSALGALRCRDIAFFCLYFLPELDSI